MTSDGRRSDGFKSNKDWINVERHHRYQRFLCCNQKGGTETWTGCVFQHRHTFGIILYRATYRILRQWFLLQDLVTGLVVWKHDGVPQSRYLQRSRTAVSCTALFTQINPFKLINERLLLDLLDQPSLVLSNHKQVKMSLVRVIFVRTTECAFPFKNFDVIIWTCFSRLESHIEPHCHVWIRSIRFGS